MCFGVAQKIEKFLRWLNAPSFSRENSTLFDAGVEREEVREAFLHAMVAIANFFHRGARGFGNFLDREPFDGPHVEDAIVTL